MLRELTDHHGSPLNDAIKIDVMDAPGPGGASCEYRIRTIQGPIDHSPIPTIRFQKGDPNKVGQNGITNEVLLTIVMDRLAGFVGGPFNTSDTEEALRCVATALQHLIHRTNDRLQRGVEGQQVE